MKKHNYCGHTPLSWTGHSLHACALFPRTALVSGMVETYHIAPVAQGAASLKLKSHRPSWAVVGAVEVRGADHGDVRRAGGFFTAEMARPGASFAWCSPVDCFIHENGNCGAVVTGAQARP